jgi:hypothetical protein
MNYRIDFLSDQAYSEYISDTLYNKQEPEKRSRRCEAGDNCLSSSQVLRYKRHKVQSII